ncbi:MAG TPA: MBL fold metallo-hydrolase [Chthoniobacterales bacterium]|jgi:phosphoribosyl 1,2-cyclic phosphodiesterase
MFSVTILASSSGGNCALLTTAKRKFLVDAGLSARQIAVRLESVGVTLGELDGIFITHEHIDHVAGLATLLKKTDLPVYCNSQTGNALRSNLPDYRRLQFFQTGAEFTVDDLTVQTFHIPHDAVDPVGYAFHCGDDCIGFLTDLGYATALSIERVRDAHTLVLESNHCEKLLQDCPKRPWSLKQRILSRHGHLSNTAASNVVHHLLERNLRQLILGHLSRDCNTPEIALSTMRQKLVALGVSDVEVHCASHAEVSPRFAVQPSRAPAADRQSASEVNPVSDDQKYRRTPQYVTELFREFAAADAA